MKKVNTAFDKIMDKILELDSIAEKDKKIILENMNNLRSQHLNILITGATGSGKSSTINALFEKPIAKVGEGVDPETMDIECYELGNITLWDSPGLGDGKERDNQHAKNIINKLNEVDENNQPLIDLVLVILDGSSRDMGTSYQLINEVIIPTMGKENSDRLIVAINQADIAMKGRGWDYEKNMPLPVLEKFLEEKVQSVKKRIKEATGVDISPIYYSAGYSENGCQQAPYNLSKLMYLIIKATPESKRAFYLDKTNKNQEMWKADDGVEKYREESGKSVFESICKGLTKGAACAAAGQKAGAVLGGILAGPAGAAIGAGVGRVIGAVGGFFSGLFG